MIFIRHVLSEMYEDVQRCIICGEIIHDYRGAMYAPNADGTIPINKGWATGDFYMSKNTNPIHLMTVKPDQEGDIIKNCK